MLDALRDGGAQAVELWAARYHVDYTDRVQMRELGGWFRGNDVGCTLHAPLTTDTSFSRHASPTVNLVESDRGRRIAAMDEVKRALEMAETMPVRTCVVHLGGRGDKWSDYVLEYCLTAVEHLKAFAGPLGVKLLLENLPNEVATPEHLLELLRVGHFDGCGVCLDVGHAHLEDRGLAATFDLLRARVAEVHVNDNGGPLPEGGADEHLVAGERGGAAFFCGAGHGGLGGSLRAARRAAGRNGGDAGDCGHAGGWRSGGGGSFAAGSDGTPGTAAGGGRERGRTKVVGVRSIRGMFVCVGGDEYGSTLIRKGPPHDHCFPFRNRLPVAAGGYIAGAAGPNRKRQQGSVLVGL